MPYRDPEKRKQYKHQYYLDHKQEIMDRVRERNKKCPSDKKRYDRVYNQKKNAPYHKILDDNGVSKVCCKCGATDNLCTHHVDGNHSNNSLNNLQWLCMSCHGRLHRQQQLVRP